MDIAALVCKEANPNPTLPSPRLPSFNYLPRVGSSGSAHVPSATAPPTIQLPAIRPTTKSETLSPKASTPRVICQLCNKTFSGVSSHNRHVSRTHHKKRPFACAYGNCGQSFGQKGSLDRHIASVHRKERPFKCEYCPKNFGRSDNLRIHVSTVHFKHRPHKCSLCSKSFGGKRPLKIHFQTVHEKKRPLECAHCSRRFGQRSNLNAHLRQVHKQEPIPSSFATSSLTGPSFTNRRTTLAAGRSIPTPLPPLGSFSNAQLSFELPTSPASSSSGDLFAAKRAISMETPLPAAALSLLTRSDHHSMTSEWITKHTHPATLH